MKEAPEAHGREGARRMEWGKGLKGHKGLKGRWPAMRDEAGNRREEMRRASA